MPAVLPFPTPAQSPAPLVTTRLPAADLFELHLEAFGQHRAHWQMARHELDRLGRSPFLPDDEAERKRRNAEYFRDQAFRDMRAEADKLRAVRDRMIREAMERARETTAVSPLDAYREHDGFPEFLSDEQWGSLDGRSVA